MSKRGLGSAVAAIVLCVGWNTLAEAQKGAKGKPTSLPATGVFQCPGLDCPVDVPVPDGIQADGPVPYGAADGANVDSLGEFSLQPASGRFLVLDFSSGSAACGAACRRTFTSIQVDANNLTVFHTNVIDPATGAEAADGLRSIPIGATWPSRLKIAFNTTGAGGEEIRWAVRFNPRDYAPSDHVAVVRTGVDTWEVFADDEQRAMLVSACCRQKGHTNEGLYAMPFRVRISTP